MSLDHTHFPAAGQSPRPFRAAVLRGLGGLLPPFLTVVLIFGLSGMVRRYVFVPVENGLNWTLAQWEARSIAPDDGADESGPMLKQIDGQAYQRASDGRYVPKPIFDAVVRHEGQLTAEGYTSWQLCRRYVQHVYLKPYWVIPGLLVIFTFAMFFLGKLLSRRLVQFVWQNVEQMIRRVPLIRNVYSSIQQVTNFLLERHNLQDAEVVAVEYPREKMWTLGYITGDGLADVTDAAGEPMVSVLMDTSPVPFNGFTCIVPRREVVKLNVTMDEALQYIISCGVITPGRKPPT